MAIVSTRLSRAIILVLGASTLIPVAYSEDNSNDVDTIIVNGKAIVVRGPAVEAAPSEVSLDAVEPVSIVNDNFIRNYISPIGDYSQVVGMTPGTYGYSPNGVALGDTKIYMRGMDDSNFNITFDGIPFNDTNGVSHHSWVFFPSQFIGGAVVDRSPGTASTIGQATYGGTIDLRSRILSKDASGTLTVSSGDWNTTLYNVEAQTGETGDAHHTRLMANIHLLNSNGYQSYNIQSRKGGSFKLESDLTDTLKLTVFEDVIQLNSNTPSIKGISRTQYLSGDYQTLLSGDPTKANYFGYNFYDVPTTFTYVDLAADYHTWSFDEKAYRYSYHNKQNYNSATSISVNSAVDKLNSYDTVGDILRVNFKTPLGELRTGVWFDYAQSYRYQIPSNPQTWVDVATPNFREHYTTTTWQPFIEHEFKLNDAFSVIAGIKYAQYQQNFVHDQDNGGAVGPLGGVYNSKTFVITGGAPYIKNDITYSDTLPSLSAHWSISPTLTAYAQYVYGDAIPSTSIFDKPNAQVSPAPKPQQAKTSQLGLVWSNGTVNGSVDVFQEKLDQAYIATAPDANGNVGWIASGSETNQGVEGELNVSLGHGLSLYVNGTQGSVKLSTGAWAPNAAKDTEKGGLTYQNAHWSTSYQVERVGTMYNNDKAGNPSFVLDPVVVSNVFVNYTFDKSAMWEAKTKLQLSVNNLGNSHAIVGIASPSTGSSSANPLGADLLSVLAARSFAVTLTTQF